MNLPGNTGDTGLIPGQGTRIPHVTEQLGPRTATAEPLAKSRRAARKDPVDCD